MTWKEIVVNLLIGLGSGLISGYFSGYMVSSVFRKKEQKHLTRNHLLLLSLVFEPISMLISKNEYDEIVKRLDDTNLEQVLIELNSLKLPDDVWQVFSQALVWKNNLLSYAKNKEKDRRKQYELYNGICELCIDLMKTREQIKKE